MGLELKKKSRFSSAIRKASMAMPVGLLAFAMVAVLGVSAATNTIAITDSTSSAENEPGWAFNRDTRNVTPYEFTNDEHSTGAGSVYVAPIGTNPSDKFIAEYFAKTPIADFESFAYDFMIAGQGQSTDADDFYLNVYANVDNSDKYYDCRFDYVEVSGSKTDFTTASINTNDAPTRVAKSGTSRLTACPATLADMPQGSYVRAFVINVGQSNASDAGLAGYLDNVVLTTTNYSTVFDFERDMPDTTAPVSEITVPTEGSIVQGAVEVRGSVTDDNELLRYYSVVKNSDGDVVAGPGTVEVSESFVDQLLYTFDSTTLADGVYTIHLESRDAAGNKDTSSTDVVTVTVNNVADNKEQCKNGGWATFSADFKNQGQCVASLQSNENSRHNRR